jgi:hypothetical protein
MKLLTPQHFSNLYKGGTVNLPAGQYVCEQPILVSGARGWALRGHGVHITGQMEFKDCESFGVEGIKFDGGRVGGDPGVGPMTLRVTECEDFRFERVDFVDSKRDHLYISDGTCEGVFEDCEFTNAWRNAVSITNGHHLTFVRPIIRDVNGTRPKAGIDIEPNHDDPAPTDITIIDAEISNVGGFGILAPKLPDAPARIVINGGNVWGGIVLHGDDHELNSVTTHGLTAIRGKRARAIDCDVTGQLWIASPENEVRGCRSNLPIKIEDAE